MILSSNGKRSAGVIGLKTIEIGGKKFLSIGMTNVREGYEGKGLATNMYRYLMENLPEGYDGILSPKETRWNNEQIPKIHEKLSKEYDKTELDNGDIVFKNKAVEQSLQATPQAGLTFTTERGSVYTVDGQRTTRNKAQREGQEDFGPKPQSFATFYLTPEDANNILFHICLVFLSALWMIANYIGFIPVLIYSAIVSHMAKPEHSYSRLFFNSMLVFFTLAALLTLINDILLTGMLFSLPGIMVAITTQPMLVRYCREPAKS